MSHCPSSRLPFCILNGLVRISICKLFQPGFGWKKQKLHQLLLTEKESRVHSHCKGWRGGFKWDLKESSGTPPPDSRGPPLLHGEVPTCWNAAEKYAASLDLACPGSSWIQSKRPPSHCSSPFLGQNILRSTSQIQALVGNSSCKEVWEVFFSAFQSPR